MRRGTSCQTFLIFFCCVFPWEVISQKLPLQYRFQHFDAKDGLGSDYTLSIAQDNHGFIWIQSRYNLTRYDAYNFQVYKHDPQKSEASLPNSELSWIYTDPTGELWITPNAPGPEYILTRYNRKTDGFIKYHLDLKGVSSRRLRFDRTGKTVWFPTPDGLFRFDHETHELSNHINPQKSESATASANIINDVSDRDSILLVGSASGLWIIDKHKKNFRRVNAPPQRLYFFQSNADHWYLRKAKPQQPAK